MLERRVGVVGLGVVHSLIEDVENKKKVVEDSIGALQKTLEEHKIVRNKIHHTCKALVELKQTDEITAKIKELETENFERGRAISDIEKEIEVTFPELDKYNYALKLLNSILKGGAPSSTQLPIGDV